MIYSVFHPDQPNPFTLTLSLITWLDSDSLNVYSILMQVEFSSPIVNVVTLFVGPTCFIMFDCPPRGCIGNKRPTDCHTDRD